MTQRERPDETVTVYRGYIVYFYDNNETVESVLTSTDHREWQSEQRLKEELQARIDKAKFTMNYDVGGYIEEVKLKLTAFRK